MSTVVPLDRDVRTEVRARMTVVSAVREALGEDAADAMLTLLSAVSVATEDVEPQNHRPEHLLALCTSAYPALVAAVTR
jgi:hypothetical protein